MKIFIFNNSANKIEINKPEILLVKEFNDLWNNDKSKDKFESKEYFKYLDFITNPRGHCYVTGLNEKEAHEYSLRQTRLPEDFEFPKNNKDIVKFVNNELQFDPINTLVNGAIKSLNITIKTINNYVSHLNNIEEQDYKDADGNYISNNADATTFHEVIKLFKEYEDTDGKFIDINRDFKSKLFETFTKLKKTMKKQ